VARSRGARRRPIPIWAQRQTKNRLGRAAGDIWPSASIVATVAQCYKAIGLLHGRYQVLLRRTPSRTTSRCPTERLSLAPQRRDRPDRASDRASDPHRGVQDQASAASPTHWIYKQGGLRRPMRRKYAWLRSLIDYPRQGAQRRGVSSSTTKLEMSDKGVSVHAKGKMDRPAARRQADRLRICGAQTLGVGDT